MQLFNNGIALDTSKEHEIEDNAEYGMDVTVISKDGSVCIFHNCTEVHYKFPRSTRGVGDACAFESDIHCTGCTRDLDNLLIISIAIAPKRHDDY